MKHLITELLVQCQNVMCGAKLMAEIYYIYNNNSSFYDIGLIDETLKHWPDLKYIISYHPDEKAALEGHKSVTIYKYDGICQLLDEIEQLSNTSLIYHFCQGKLFGYNDHEVMKFIQKELDEKTK